MKVKEKTFLESFYIIDLIKNLLKSKNWMAMAYLLLNILIVASIPTVLFEGFNLEASLTMVFLYFLVSFFVLSPFGEWILRFQQGCKKITDINILNRLEPLFMDVWNTVKRKHPEMMLDEDINLYIIEDGDVNAFALGRRTVCVTTGLLNCSDEQIKGVLGHEFGHLAMHDTDLILLITVGNFIISAMVTIFRFFIWLYSLIFSLIGSLIGGSDGIVVNMINLIASFLTMVLVNGVMFIWTKLGVLMVMKSSRNAEFEADAFSCDLGYSEGLVSFLKSLLPAGINYPKKGSIEEKMELFSILSSSHPRTEDRLDRINNFAKTVCG